MRLAAIDIGSNAARLILSDPGSSRAGESLAQRVSRVPLGLGRDVFAQGRVGERRARMLVQCLRGFRERLEDWDAQAWDAVGTSALREAANGPQVLERASREAGVPVRVIDGAEEGRLCGLAVRHRLPQLDPASALVMDVGGGSTELGLLGQGETMESFRLGTLRTPRLDEPAARERFQDMQRRAGELLAGVPDRQRRIVGMGGNINSAAQRLGYAPGGSVPAAQLAAFAREVAALSQHQRVRQLGMKPDRAYALPQALQLFLGVVEVVGADAVLVPKVGVGDGLVLDQLARLQSKAAADSQKPAQGQAAPGAERLRT